MGGQEHFYMEPQSMLVVPVGEERELNVYVSTQWPALTQVTQFAFPFSPISKEYTVFICAIGPTGL